VAKDRSPSRWRAIPENDFATTAQTPSRQILFRDRASAKKHPRLRKDASEPENRGETGGCRLLRHPQGAKCDRPASGCGLGWENSSRGRDYLPFRRWRAKHFGGAKNRLAQNRQLQNRLLQNRLFNVDSPPPDDDL
jgi:hypothetical protein